MKKTFIKIWLLEGKKAGIGGGGGAERRAERRVAEFYGRNSTC